MDERAITGTTVHTDGGTSANGFLGWSEYGGLCPPAGQVTEEAV